MKVDKVRERDKTDVCSEQNCSYSSQLRWIDKGNGFEAQYDLKVTSKMHNWSPKLVWCLFNMHDANMYTRYARMRALHTPDNRLLNVTSAMDELKHVRCQQGEPILKQKAEHPSWVSNVKAGIFSQGLGHKVKCTAHGTILQQEPKDIDLGDSVAAVNTKKKYIALETTL